MAWDRVTPTTIANCFAKCGFFRSSEEVPSEQEEPIEGWELLDAGCTAEDFCTADDNLATCGARTVEDIVEEATCEVADSSDDGDNIDEGDGEGPPPAAETLHALDVLRRAMAADEISDDTRVCCCCALSTDACPSPAVGCAPPGIVISAQLSTLETQDSERLFVVLSELTG
ncbi:hypothetical protein HPB52_013300 [Rhipicephalus sanguineus]|uniref:Uncharacterized protein n=1 Tax=Rhipicephalus sanguineus TaxID=34632 RepID=A0A9D4TA46_RHISA|nr:hypothetical protein HPB52_013300 [Rhipicephalus sanguineus]